MKSSGSLSETVKYLEVRNTVYRFLTESHKLEPSHVTALRKRGFPDNMIYGGLGYFSMPKLNDRNLLAQQVIDKFGLEKIKVTPGFYTKDSAWTLAGSVGLAIPVRDLDGKILALKIRADDPCEGPRYTSLSSKDKENGTESGSFVHVSNTCGAVRGSKTIRITEGEIKADLATLHTGVPTLSIPGVGCWRMAIPVVEQIGPEKILLAMDSDARIKPEVANALIRLHDAFKDKYDVTVEVWDPVYKGIDDLLLAQQAPQALVGTELQAYLDSLPKPEQSSKPDKASPL